MDLIIDVRLFGYNVQVSRHGSSVGRKFLFEKDDLGNGFTLDWGRYQLLIDW